MPKTQSYRFQGAMTALSSITHFGDSVGGTEQILRREKIIQRDGTVEEVPVISGNSWRGQLRDCGMRAMLGELAVTLGHDITLPTPAFYLLFSGGALTKDSGRGLDMDMARRLRDLIPLLAIFGGAVGRNMLDGKLSVGKIVPVCAETVDILPETLRRHPHTAVSVYDRLQSEHYTRMDDAKRESLASAYLPAPEQRLLEAPKTKTVTNRKTGETEEIAADPGVATQMRYGYETISAGTVFSCSLGLRDVTDLEFEAFMAALRAWSTRPIIGGKSSIGMGEVELQFPGWSVAQPRLEQTEAVDTPFGTHYAAHLQTNAEAIVRELEAIK